MQNKSVVIHQIHFLPWLPYLAKIAKVDIFVILDDIGYKPRYYINRTKLLYDNNLRWLIVPTNNGTQNKKTNEVLIHYGKEYKKITNILTQNFNNHENFNLIKEYIEYINGTKDEKLIDLNLNLIKIFFKQLNLKLPKILYSSVLLKNETIIDKTHRKILLCKKTNSNILINGFGGSVLVHDIPTIKSAGIKMLHINKKLLFDNHNFYEKYTGISFIYNILFFGLEKTKQDLQQLINLYDEKL